MKHLVVTIAVCLAASSVSAQENDQGFFGRLFGSDEASNEEDQGTLLERLIEDNLSGDGREVSITGFSGALSGRATMAELVITDENGAWLTLTDAVLDWNRAALFRGRLEVAELSAAEIFLPRLPPAGESTEAPTPEATGFSLPELPVAINIERIAAERVLIGQPVAGVEIDARVEGGLRLEDGEGGATLAIDRRDGAGQIALDTSYANDTQNLSLSLNVNEGANGIISQLIGLPGDPSVDFTVTGDAPITAFAADLRLATDAQERLVGRVTTNTPMDGGLRLDADLRGDLAPLFAPEYQSFFGDDVALVTQVITGVDGSTTLENLTLRAEAVNLNGRVVIGGDSLPRQISLTGEISDGGAPVLLPLAGDETRVDRVDLDVTFDADVSDDWTGDFRISGLDRAGFAAETLNLSGSGRILSGEQASVSADLIFGAINLDLGDAEAEAALGERVDGGALINWSSGGPITLRELRIAGETYGLAGQADVSVDDGPEISGQAQMRADDLSVFAGLAERAIAGAAELRATFGVRPLDGIFTVKADGTTRDLIVAQPEADRILAGEVLLDLAAERDEAGIRATLTTLESANAALTGAVDLRSGGSTIALDGQLADAALLLPEVTGPVTLDIAAEEDNDRVWSWQVATQMPGTDLSANGTAIDVFGTPIIGLSGQLSSQDLSDFASLVDLPLSGAVDASVSGEIKSDLSRASGAVTGTVTNLTTGIAEADALLQGDVAIDLDAAMAGDVLSLRRGLITGPQIALDATAVLAGTRAGRFAVKGQVTDASRLLDGAPSAPIQLTSTGRQDGQDWDVDASVSGPDLSATLDGTAIDPRGTPGFDGQATLNVGNLEPFSALAKRRLGGSIAMTAAGNVTADLTQLDLQTSLSTQDLRLGESQIDPLLTGEIEAQVTASRTGDTITVSTGQITSDLADVTIQRLAILLSDAPEADGAVSIQAKDLSRLSQLAGMPLRGRVTVEAEGSGVMDASAFDVSATATGTGLSIGSPQADRLLSGTLRAALDASGEGEIIEVARLSLQTALLNATASGALGADSKLDIDATLADIAPFVDGFSGPLTANGTVGQRSNRRYTVDLSARGPGGMTATVNGSAAEDFGTVDIDLNGAAPLGLANRLIAPRSILGNVQFDLGVTGAPALESVSGRITAADARLVEPSVGIALNDIDVTTTLGGGRANLDIGAAVEGGGRLGITGPVTLSGSYPAEINVALNGIVLRDPRLYETSVDGQIAVRGALLGGAGISGALNLGETNVRIPSTGLGGSGEVPTILHINEPPRVRSTRRRAGVLDTNSGGAASAGPGYPLDITITAPNRIFIRGRGLDSEFGGALRVAGDTNNVVPIGAFDLVRGRLDILGNRLTLDEATATLQGSFIPVLNISATTETDDFTIVVGVTGPASEPEISFSSEPELPQEEVLARLLFGRGLDTLSPIQAARLALAVRTLAGQGGEGVVSKVRQGAGLADLDVTTDEEGNAAVTAGAYLGENLYTDVTVGSSGETELNLNLDVSKSVTIKGGFTNEGDSSIGIFFERDY